jgi:hypothetical protein
MTGRHRLDPSPSTTAGAQDTPLTRRLGLHEGPPARVLWQIDPDAGVATSNTGHRATALALASAVLDLRVTQVANQSWGIHALLPAGAMFADPGFSSRD